MNTPKLASLLSSPLANTDPARANRPVDPARGLDFSQLLGERRAQPVAAQRRAENDNTSGRNAASTDPQRQTSSARARTNDAAQDSSQPNDRSAASREAGSASATASVPAHESRASQASTTVAQRPEASTPATNERSAGAGTSPAVTGVESTSAAAAPAILIGAQTDALLAEQAAESGLAAVIGGNAVAALSTPDAASQPVTPDSAVAAPTIIAPLPADSSDTIAGSLPGASFAAADASAGPTDTQPLSATSPAVAHATPDLATLASGGPATDVPALPATDVPALPTTAVSSSAAQNTAAPAVNPATFALDAATLARQDAESFRAAPANATPAPLAADATNSAAALSLQDFTAMVEAARATSGTQLPPATPLQQAPVSMSTVPGLVPGGLFGAQPLSSALPGTPGIAAPLNSPQWPTEFGRQFISIAQGANGLGQVAELRLDPPDLGPLRITINLNDNVAHAVFSSPHAAVRQTVENALPQLQHMLEQAGISLGQANVNDQQQPGNPFQGEGNNGNRHTVARNASGAADASIEEDIERPSRPADPSLLVDTFA